MNNEETVEKIIKVFDSYNLYEGDFVPSCIVRDIVSVFGEEGNDVVSGVLSELDYIDNLITEENFVEIGNRLECLRGNLISSDIPKIITNTNVVLGKVFESLKDPVRKAELDGIIHDALDN